MNAVPEIDFTDTLPVISEKAISNSQSFHLLFFSLTMPPSSAYNLVTLPSLTGNLNELPTMRRVEPQLIHLSDLSSTNSLSEGKLRTTLERNPSLDQSVTNCTHKPLPPVDDEDHIMMRKPSRLPVHSVLPGTVMTYPPTRSLPARHQRYSIGKSIVLEDGRCFAFEELVGKMWEDETGDRIQYVRFKCPGTMRSIAHMLITPVYLDKEDDISQSSSHSHHWCSWKESVMGCFGSGGSCSC